MPDYPHSRPRQSRYTLFSAGSALSVVFRFVEFFLLRGFFRALPWPFFQFFSRLNRALHANDSAGRAIVNVTREAITIVK